MFLPSVLERAERLNLREHDLIVMIHKAALCSFPGWNRRYHEFVFHCQPDGFTVDDMSVLDKSDELGRIPSRLQKDEFLVYEDCGQCGGVGCESCDQGQVARKRKLAQ